MHVVLFRIIMGLRFAAQFRNYFTRNNCPVVARKNWLFLYREKIAAF